MYHSNTAFSDTKIGTASKSSNTSYVNFASSLTDVQQETCKGFSINTVGYTEVMSEMKCLMAWRTILDWFKSVLKKIQFRGGLKFTLDMIALPS